MNTPSIQRYTQVDARKYIGRVVKTTHGTHGMVVTAWVQRDDHRIIKLMVRDSLQKHSFYTDNEHATIVRGED